MDAYRPSYSGGAARPEYPGAGRSTYNYPSATRPGHLGAWLSQHQNLPFQQQEQLLRRDPSFNRLPASDQQRLIQQLHHVDQMPAQERERRLARAEAIERLSPEARMQLNRASREFAGLSPDRRALVKRAFQDLRSVPLDERQTVLNSQRYQGVFTPQERSILGNFLSVEPYEPPR